MPDQSQNHATDLYIIAGPSGCGKTTLIKHVAKTFDKIRDKDGSFDHSLLTISDDYAFAPEEEIQPDNIRIVEHMVYLTEYSFPSIYRIFGELSAEQIRAARQNYYSRVLARAEELMSTKPEIIMVEGALIQSQADIDLISESLLADHTHVVYFDLGYARYARSPRWTDDDRPKRHRYNQLLSRLHMETTSTISSFKQASLPWWPYQAKTMPPEVKFARLGLETLSPSGKTVVDLCCNEGGIAALCAKTGANALGVDHNFMAFVMATREYPDVEFQLEETFRFLEASPDKAYDIGLLLGSLHYFPQTHLLLTELARVFQTIIIEPVLTADDYEGDGLLHRPPPYNDVIMTREFFESYVARYFRTVQYYGPSVPPKDGSNRHIYHLHTS